MIWALLTATAVGHRQSRKRRQHKYRASTNAGVCPLCVNDVLLANLGTRGVVRPSSRCGDRRRVLLWHELGCASGADGAVRRRLPVASFVAASKRTAAGGFVGERARGRLAAWLPEWTIFDSDVERRYETPAFLGEQKYDLAGACSDSANPR